MTCCLLEKAEMEWGTTPLAGPSGRRRFFRRFSAHFCVTLEHLFLKRQKICGKSARKSAQKSAHQKSEQKSAQKICAPKICAKMGAKICAKICAPKICAKNRFEHSVFWKMEARKKRQKKTAPNMCKTPAPSDLRQGGPSQKSSLF